MKNRYERDSRETELRVGMLRNNIRVADIARALSVSASGVTAWLQDRSASKRITAYFLTRGCPNGLVASLRKVNGAA